MKTYNMRSIVALVALIICLAPFCPAAEPSRLATDSGDLVHCQNGVVVSVHPLASRIGVDALVRGGTAVDAAVATAFALAVTWPGAGNIGGGGYMVVVPTSGKAVPVVVDFREVAPAAATKEMFVKPAGRSAHRRVGVPGTVRGLALAHGRFGRLPWRDLVLPGVRLARDGFVLDAATAASLNEILGKSDRQTFAELHRVYGRPGGGAWKPGERLVQPELAATLQEIAERGPDGFYLGTTADKLAAEMSRGGGLITREDLAAYRAKFREPVRGTYRGFEIVSVPPSSSGGTTLIEELNILENFDLHAQGRWSAETLHLMIEAAKRAFRDRACYLGDPDRATVEPALSREHPSVLKQLEAMGHVVRVSKDEQGDAHSIWIDQRTGDLTGAADKRENGSAAGY
jgi:gamma-glutamyltranspeptidase/glutathione hydrolase